MNRDKKHLLYININNILAALIQRYDTTTVRMYRPDNTFFTTRLNINPLFLIKYHITGRLYRYRDRSYRIQVGTYAQDVLGRCNFLCWDFDDHVVG